MHGHKYAVYRSQNNIIDLQTYLDFCITVNICLNSVVYPAISYGYYARRHIVKKHRKHSNIGNN